MKTPEQHIRQVTWTGLIVNVLLSGLKLIAGILGHSQTLMADAFHSLSDSITDVAILVGSHFWAKPPDEGHPYGHRRLETFVTIFIGFVLLIAGAGIGWRAIVTLHQNHTVQLGWIALVVTAVSIVLKEALYRWTMQVGKRHKSAAMVANAWHHRLDAISSVPAFIAVGGAILVPEWGFLDHIGAIIVCTLIMRAAFQIIGPCMKELLDTSAPEEIRKAIHALASGEAGVVHVHAVRTRYVSNSLMVDLHVVVDGEMTVRAGHDISENVQRRLLEEGPNIEHVVVHIEPAQVEPVLSSKA